MWNVFLRFFQAFCFPALCSPQQESSSIRNDLMFLSLQFPKCLAAGIPFPPDAVSRTAFPENNRL